MPPQRDASPRAREGGVDVVGVAHACGLRDDERAEEVGAGLGEGNVAERDGAGVVRDEGGPRALVGAPTDGVGGARGRARGGWSESRRAHALSLANAANVVVGRARPPRLLESLQGRARRARGVRAARREGRRATTRRARSRSRDASASHSAASSAARAAAREASAAARAASFASGMGPRARVVVSLAMAPDERVSGRRNARRERQAVGRAPRARHATRARFCHECVTRESQGIFRGVEVILESQTVVVSHRIMNRRA